MASASTPKVRLSKPLTAAADKEALRGWSLVTAVLLLLALLALASARAGAGSLSAAVVVLSTLAACALWWAHLDCNPVAPWWSIPLAALIACQLMSVALRAGIPASEWMKALGSGIFVYVMLWVSEMHETQPGLRPVATLALLLSIGMLAKPAVAISCALLGLTLFLGSRRRFGGALSSSLLLFTPAVLCVLVYFGLDILTAGAMKGAVPSIVRMHPAVPALGRLDPALLLRQASALWFPAAVLLVRALRRRSGSADVAYLMVLVFLTTAGAARWMPEALSDIDIRTIATAGASCLLALAPPENVLLRALVLCGAALPLL